MLQSRIQASDFVACSMRLCSISFCPRFKHFLDHTSMPSLVISIFKTKTISRALAILMISIFKTKTISSALAILNDKYLQNKKPYLVH